jgi:hypothetical protein
MRLFPDHHAPHSTTPYPDPSLAHHLPCPGPDAGSMNAVPRPHVACKRQMGFRGMVGRRFFRFTDALLFSETPEAMKKNRTIGRAATQTPCPFTSFALGGKCSPNILSSSRWSRNGGR